MAGKLKDIVIILGIILASVVTSLVAIFVFGIIFVGIEPIFRSYSVDFGNLIFFSYLLFYVVINLGISIFCISKTIYRKFFIMYAPISLISTIVLVFFIGAFYR